MQGTAHIHDARHWIPANEPLQSWHNQTVIVTTEHARSSYGLPVLLSGDRVIGTTELPEWAEVRSIVADDGPSDPAPAFDLLTFYADGDPYGEWAERRSAADRELREAVRAAGYRMEPVHA